MRSREPSRLEGFSDAVFGFALTLLVVSQQVPDTFDDLVQTMRGFFAFAICFAILFRFWHLQNLFCRRFDLQDGYTTFLNGILLFMVMFYVYPLKFLMNLIVERFIGGSTTVKQPDGSMKLIIDGRQLPIAYMFYFVGLATVFLIFSLLYLHAYRHRKELELTAREIFETRAEIANNVFGTFVGLSSIWLMAVVHKPYALAAAFVYLVVLVGGAVGYQALIRRRRKALLRTFATDRAVVPSPLEHTDASHG